MVQLISVCIFLIFISSCDKHDEIKIGDTNYYYVEWGRYDKFVVHNSGSKDIVIPNIVLGYISFSRGAIVVRQVSQSHDCDDGSISTEIQKEIEVWVIDKDNESLYVKLPTEWVSFLKGKYQVTDEEINILTAFIADTSKESFAVKTPVKCTEVK